METFAPPCTLYTHVHLSLLPDIPVCGRQGQGVGVGKHEEARVVCHVDGNPPPTDFFWEFNSTSEFRPLPEENVIVDGSVSIATYVPESEMDYGTLLCWGRNELGKQRRACVFNIIPAGEVTPIPPVCKRSEGLLC